MTRQDSPWEEKPDPHAERRDEKQKPRMPVSGKSVLLLSRIVRAPSRKRGGPVSRPATIATRHAADQPGSQRSHHPDSSVKAGPKRPR